MTSKKTSLLKFILDSIRPYHRHCAFVMFAMIYSGLHLSLEPYLLKILMDQVTTYTGPHLVHDHLSFIFLFFLAGGSLAYMWRLKDYYLLRMLPKLKSSLVDALFEHSLNLPQSFYQRHHSGNIASHIGNFVENLEEFLDHFREGFRQLTVILIASIFLLLVHPIFSGVLLLWALAFICVGYFEAKRISLVTQSVGRTRSSVFGKVLDVINNHSNVRLFSRHGYETMALSHEMTKLTRKEEELRSTVMNLWSIQSFLACAMVCGMLYILLVYKEAERISLGDFALVMWIAVGTVDQIWTITDVLGKATQHWGVCSQIFSDLFTDTEEHLSHPPLTLSHGRIEFRNVNFSFGEGCIFEDLNITIEGGSKVGLVGYSGSGKSSFIHLILKLLEPSKGQILIDQQPLDFVSPESLRDKISFVPQNDLLFRRSIFENIRYGDLSASLGEVQKAAILAEAHDFITETPSGYESLIGEEMNLSGGQRQRIAIARAVLRQSPILILDEATSALDSLTERKIQKRLNEAMKGRTTLVAAHRLSTLVDMDRILVFDRGRIVEDGSHAELLNQKGLYSRLWLGAEGEAS